MNEQTVNKEKISQWLKGKRPEKVTAIILSGGKSKRMGKDKATMKIDGLKMIDRIINKLNPFFDEIIISISSKKHITETPNIKMIYDKKLNQGPLMGLYSSLSESSNHVNFVIACDIPFIDIEFVNRLLSGSVEYEISVPSFSKNRFEPLYAMYTKSCLSQLENLIKNKQFKLSALIKNCNSEIITMHKPDWYYNLNTPDDFSDFLTVNTNLTSTLNIG